MSRRSDRDLARILRLMARRWRRNSRPTRRAENADSDLWVGLDRETDPAASSQQIAARWAALALTPAMVDTIASRMRRRPEFQQVLREVDAEKLRRLVQLHRERLRLIHLDGLRQHLEALRSLQFAQLT
jgi:hypothetical protein